MTLKELLNKLIEKGWKPFGEGIDRSPYYNCDVGVYERVHGKKIVSFHSKHHKHPKTLRQLVSKESGLWQFVCENGMVDGVDRWTLNARQKSIYDKFITSEKEYTPKMDYEYRLIESALKDESELEDFLLDNIKVE